MTVFNTILLIVGATFAIFGYFIYFKKKYNLINGFEVDFKKGNKTESYAKKVGLVELIIGIVLIIVVICRAIIQ